VGRTAGTPGVIREFIGLPSPTGRRAGAGGHPCQGLYYRGVGRKPKVAVIAAHYQIDFSEHYLADYLATRGIGFLGWNTRFRGFESSFLSAPVFLKIEVSVCLLSLDYVRFLKGMSHRVRRVTAGCSIWNRRRSTAAWSRSNRWVTNHCIVSPSNG